MIITSTFFSGDPELIQLYASDSCSLLSCDIPKFPGHFTGTGDLLSSMLLTQMELHDFEKAVEISVNVMRGVLKTTVEQPLMGTNEISLVKSKKIIEEPTIELKV